MRTLSAIAGISIAFILACGGGDGTQELMELSAAMDPSGSTGCLAECMKMNDEAMKLLEAGKSTESMRKSDEAMACVSRCEEGGGRAAAAASGVGDNTTGCLAECSAMNTKAMELLEAGDTEGSMRMSQKAMDCTNKCD